MRSHHIYPGLHLLLLLLGHVKDHTQAGDDVEDQHHNAILHALFHLIISVLLLSLIPSL